MRREFTCAHCGKQNIFDTTKVAKRVDIIERAGDSSELVAYLPTCRYCGTRNRISPSSPADARHMSHANRSTKASTPRKSQRSPTTPTRSKGWRALAAEQGVKAVEDFDEFLDDVGHVWPENENVDDFLDWLREARGEGLRDH